MVAEPRQRWVTSRLPAINPAFALAEVVWILTGRSDARFLTHWNPGLTRFVGADVDLHGAYGRRLRGAHGLDQLRSAYATLSHNPDSRQVVLQIWSATLDLPDTEGRPRSEDVPCNIASCLKVRDGALHWLQTLRSNDIFLGVPHNVVQFTMLQEIIAGWLKLDMGEYVQVSDSLHLYDRDAVGMLTDALAAPAVNTDRFRDDFDVSNQRFEALAHLMETLIDGTSHDRASACSAGLELPREYANIFAVVAADDSRRRGDGRFASRLMSRCTNDAYQQLWDRWCQRQAARGAGSQVSVVVHQDASGPPDVGSPGAV